jgi:hypothetical protein
MGVNVTRIVKFIRKGDKGSDAVRYWLIPSVSSVSMADVESGDGKPTPSRVTCRLVKQVGDDTPTTIATPSSVGLTIQYTIQRNDGVLSALVNYTGAVNVPTNTACRAIEFYLYRGSQLIDTATVAIVCDGDKGDRGPALRGPQAWSDCATGYGFQCGAEGEAWKDVVLYGNNYYSCVKSHTKTASNYPGSTTDQSNGYWQLGDKIELVATKILLATYALVKNLGVECIDMRDAAGNILFQAKDGNVTCKTGTFENIKVSGDITAEYLNLKLSTGQHYEDAPALANGSICIQASGIILPELPAGTARSMRVLNSLQTRTSPGNLVLKPATPKVLISKTLSEMNAVNANVTLENCGYNGGKYMELIGIRQPNSDYTVWLSSEMNNGVTIL